MTNKVILLVMMASLTAIFACQHENNIIPTNNSDMGYEYFPLNVGDEYIYKITYKDIDTAISRDTTTEYFIKDIVESQLIDNQGDTAFRIERYRRNSDTFNWIIDFVWTAKRTFNTGEIMQNNRRFVKLRFPLKKDLCWDKNLYNDADSVNIFTTAVNSSFVCNNTTYDSCTIVAEDTSSSLIHKNCVQEVYALGIGLIYKEISFIESQNITNIPIEQRISKAKIYTRELIHYNAATD